MGKPLLLPAAAAVDADAGGGGGTDKNTDGSSTNKGYRISVILNLLARSFARLKVILRI